MEALKSPKPGGPLIDLDQGGVFDGERRLYRRKKTFTAMRIRGAFTLSGPDGERKFRDGYAILGDDGLWHGMEAADFERVFEPAYGGEDGGRTPAAGGYRRTESGKEK